MAKQAKKQGSSGKGGSKGGGRSQGSEKSMRGGSKGAQGSSSRSQGGGGKSSGKEMQGRGGQGRSGGSTRALKVPKSFQNVGEQIAKFADTEIGRRIMAEVLVQAATALSRSLPSADEMARAGSKAGAAVVGAGSAAAGAGARAAPGGARSATSAKDVAMNVASAAAGAIGDVMLDSARKLLPGGGGGR